MGFLAGWVYRKKISITGKTGAGMDYQVLLSIGALAGGDFHLEGHCTNFPQDITITTDDGETKLDHWVEDLTADPITVWVEVADSLEDNVDIYVYYGKSCETTLSNGPNTFLQFHGAATSDFIDSAIVNPVNIIYEAKINSVGSGTSHDNRYGMSNNADFGVDDAFGIGDEWGAVYAPLSWNEAAVSYSTSTKLAAGTFRIKSILTSSSVSAYVDDVEVGTPHSTNLPDENLGLGIQTVSGAAPNQEWAFVRKYAADEPAFNSAGAEENILSSLSPLTRWMENVGA